MTNSCFLIARMVLANKTNAPGTQSIFFYVYDSCIRGYELIDRAIQRNIKRERSGKGRRLLDNILILIRG